MKSALDKKSPKELLEMGICPDCHTKFIDTKPDSQCSVYHLGYLETHNMLNEWLDKWDLSPNDMLGEWIDSSVKIQIGGNHYKSMEIQPVEYIHKNNLGFIQGNIIKYITRYKDKGGLEDLRKAKHMMELLAEFEYGEKL